MYLCAAAEYTMTPARPVFLMVIVYCIRPISTRQDRATTMPYFVCSQSQAKTVAKRV